MSLPGRPATERVQVFQRYPDAAAMPAPLVYSLALALAKAQRFDEAAYLAARALGDASQADLRARICKPVEGDDNSLAVSNGIGLVARGLTLRECGRSQDARRALEAAIQATDRNLSQYLAREALASLPR